MTAMREGALIAPDAPDASKAPLPARITVRRAPLREPAYDDERDERDGAAAGRLQAGAPAQPMLPLELRPHRLRREVSPSAPRLTRRRELPDPQVWVHRLLVILLETRTGQRPLSQLAPYVSPSILAGLTEARDNGQWNARRVATLRTIRCCEPADGVAELAAVIEFGTRCRAIAVRLEGLGGRWRCTRLQIG
jgi:hypothetical protein